MLDPELGNYVRGVLNSADALESTTERLLVIALAQYADAEGRGAFPSNATLARQIGCHPRTVRGLLRKLEARGVVSRRGSHDRLGTNIYDLKTDFSGAGQGTPATAPVRTHAPLSARQANPKPDQSRLGGEIVPPPPGVRPSEYQYLYVDKRKRDPYKNSEENNNKRGNSEGLTPPSRRRKIDTTKLGEEIDLLRIRFSYFLADCLIARGRKKRAFRDDAQTPEWLDYMGRVTFGAFGTWPPVGLLDLEEALEYHLDTEDGAYVRKPRHLSPDRLRKLIDTPGVVTAPSDNDPAPSRADVSVQQMREMLDAAIAAKDRDDGEGGTDVPLPLRRAGDWQRRRDGP